MGTYSLFKVYWATPARIRSELIFGKPGYSINDFNRGHSPTSIVLTSLDVFVYFELKARSLEIYSIMWVQYMLLFKPTKQFKRVTDIEVEVLQELDVQAILLDVDETLALHGSQQPFEGAIEWTQRVTKAGIPIVIVSNNFKRRVAPFAKKFDLPFVSLSLKPLPLGFYRAKRLCGKKVDRVLVVGDQVFTDVLGANLAGMLSILLEPASQHKTKRPKLRRRLEKFMRDKWKDSL